VDVVEHDRATGLTAVRLGDTERILDITDLAIVGAMLIRFAVAGRSVTPDLVRLAIAESSENA
jgi:hypothetical protein